MLFASWVLQNLYIADARRETDDSAKTIRLCGLTGFFHDQFLDSWRINIEDITNYKAHSKENDTKELSNESSNESIVEEDR